GGSRGAKNAEAFQNKINPTKQRQNARNAIKIATIGESARNTMMAKDGPPRTTVKNTNCQPVTGIAKNRSAQCGMCLSCGDCACIVCSFRYAAFDLSKRFSLPLTISPSVNITLQATASRNIVAIKTPNAGSSTNILPVL